MGRVHRRATRSSSTARAASEIWDTRGSATTTTDHAKAWASPLRPIAASAQSGKVERTYLYAAPTELVQVLPKAQDGVRYYVAGRNVVAVSGDYKVVDSISVPSLYMTKTRTGKLDEDDREDLEDAAEDGDAVEIEVDEDGDVDVDDK